MRRRRGRSTSRDRRDEHVHACDLAGRPVVGEQTVVKRVCAGVFRWDSPKRMNITGLELRPRGDVLPVLPRGPFSAAVINALSEPAADRVDGLTSAVNAEAEPALWVTADIVHDEDVQLALYLLYASSYGSLPIDSRWEWDPTLVSVRRRVEADFESQVRARVGVLEVPEPTADAVARSLFDLTAPSGGPSLSRFVARLATVGQLREFVIHRTVYTLREADPHSWAIPRLTGRAKAALVEIQFDEYGSGDPSRVHATLFANTVRGVGLDDTYGAYLDRVPAITLASHNLMSMFGLNRRLRGALVGHLAAFEMTSAIPNRSYAEGFRRAGFGADVTDYFDEHVQADAIHEQIAARDLAGSLAEDEPDLLPDILFGAAACLSLDDAVAEHMHAAFRAGRSSLRPVPSVTP